MKIIDKINSVLQAPENAGAGQQTNKTHYSFEYFPPRTEQGIHSFKTKIIC